LFSNLTSFEDLDGVLLVTGVDRQTAIIFVA